MEYIGRYRIEGEIGAGGFGAVYRARDPAMNDRLVAIKVFRPRDEELARQVTSATGDAVQILRERFITEAQVVQERLAAAPHVVRIYHFDVLEDGTPYYVMPFYERAVRSEIGRDLTDARAIAEAAAADKPRPYPPSRALAILGQVAKALASVHAAGIVHRDLKPANLMFDTAGDVVLVDFGIAKVPETEASRSLSGVAMGTVAYMAPEQRESAKHVDARADVYAWGVLAYRLLTGALPIGRFRDPIELVPELGTALNALILQALELDVTRRPESGTALARAFFEGVPSGEELPEESATLAGGDGQPPLRDELSPLRERIEALLLAQGEIGKEDWPGLEVRAEMVDLDRAGLEALIQGEEERLADRVLPLKRFLGAVDRRYAEHGAALPGEIRAALVEAGQDLGWPSERVEAVLSERERLARFVPQTVAIPGGRFRMGCVSGQGCYDNETPVHEVRVSGFRLTKYEITFDQYDEFAAATGRSRPDDEGWGRGRRPVINVSWNDAKAYAAWLSEQTGQSWRLPTEAEWEYAARGGTSTAYPWGNAIGSGNANCDGCGSQWDGRRTAPVGSFPANPFGLHDMHGNVWEWTEDCWHDSYAGAPTDGRAWESASGGDCSFRVLRGGSWDSTPRLLRSAARVWDTAADRDNSNGFRLVQDAR